MRRIAGYEPPFAHNAYGAPVPVHRVRIRQWSKHKHKTLVPHQGPPHPKLNSKLFRLAEIWPSTTTLFIHDSKAILLLTRRRRRPSAKPPTIHPLDNLYIYALVYPDDVCYAVRDRKVTKFKADWVVAEINVYTLMRGRNKSQLFRTCFCGYCLCADCAWCKYKIRHYVTKSAWPVIASSVRKSAGGTLRDAGDMP